MALLVASRLGIKSDYEQHLSGRAGWISELVEDYLRNEQVCIRKSMPTIHLSDRLMAFAEAMVDQQIGRKTKTTNRKRRRLLRRLVALEVHRVRQEKEFWAELVHHGMECCGTMFECPLQATCRNENL